MKTTTSLVIFCLLLVPAAWAQDQVTGSFEYGRYFHNSENSLRTIGGQSFTRSLGFSVGYEKKDLWGMDIGVAYSYGFSVVRDALVITRVNPYGQNILAQSGVDLSFSTHNVDLTAFFYLTDLITAGIGPTVGLTHRTIATTLPKDSPTEPSLELYDRLAAVSIGLHFSVNTQIPLQRTVQYPYICTTLTLRYLHGALFDARGRDLSNYHQDSLAGSAGVGLGYAF